MLRAAVVPAAQGAEPAVEAAEAEQAEKRLARLVAVPERLPAMEAGAKMCFPEQEPVAGEGAMMLQAGQVEH